MISHLRARLVPLATGLALVLMGVLALAPQPSLALAQHNDAGEWFYNNVLDEGQKLAYDQILEQVQNDPTILMDGDDPSDVTVDIPVNKLPNNGSTPSGWLPGIINAFTRDHPEYFWINAGALAWERIADGDANTPRTYRLALNAAYPSFIYTGIDEAQLPNMWDELNEKVNEIVAASPADTLQALTYFDNWLSANNTYNVNGLGAENISRCAYSGIMSDNDGAAGPVCYGYATALKVLLDRANIENAYIEGRAYNGTNGSTGEQHAWNAVKFQSAWYAIDPTWNDPGLTGAPSNRIYFMVGSDTETTPLLAGKTKFSENHVAIPVEGLNYDDLTLSADQLSGITPAVAQVILPNGSQQTASTFEDAIQVAAGNKGTTIRLWAPVTVNNTVVIPDGTTIDLNSQYTTTGTNTNTAIYCATNKALEIEDGSTVTILNKNASRIVSVYSASGSAIENHGTLLVGPFVQIRALYANSEAVSPNGPRGVEGAYIASISKNNVTTYEVELPGDQTAALTFGTADDATVSGLLARVGDTGSGIALPQLRYRANPASEELTAPTNAPANEWVLSTAPQGAGDSDSDKLVNGDYAFILRPQGSDATDYYGYTVTLTVSVAVPKTVEELRAEQKQQLDAALAGYAEADYLTDDWADIEAAYQAANDAIDAANDEAAMREAVAAFSATVSNVPTAAQRLAAEQRALTTALETAFASYQESDYTAENWAALKAAYEQGLSAIASATTIADAQAAQGVALDSMSAVATKPTDPSEPTDPSDPSDPGTVPEPPAGRLTVTFDSRVPGAELTTVVVAQGSTVARPADPALEGWRFTGWFSDTALTREWNFSDPVTSDLVLHAGWERVTAAEPERPSGEKSDALAATGDPTALLAPAALAVAGAAALAASRRR